MKTRWLGLVLLSLLAQSVFWPAHAASPTLKVEFSTAPSGSKYSPKHVLAVWVTDAKTNLVATLMRQAGKRQKYLSTWNAQRAGKEAVDGVSGATLTAHEKRVVTWNCCSASKEVVPAGDYLLFIELTDFHGQGPLAVLPFAKSAAGFSKTYPDQKLISNIKLELTN